LCATFEQIGYVTLMTAAGDRIGDHLVELRGEFLPHIAWSLWLRLLFLPKHIISLFDKGLKERRPPSKHEWIIDRRC
jgi:hypothetical protein